MLRFLCGATVSLCALFASAYEKGDEVVVIARPTTQADPQDPDRVTFNYGEPLLVHDVNGDRLSALHFGRMSKVSTSEVVPLYFLARAQQHYHAGNYEQATGDFEQVLKIDPESVESVRGHLLTALERKQYDIVRRDKERLEELKQPLDDEEWRSIERRISGKPEPTDLSK